MSSEAQLPQRIIKYLLDLELARLVQGGNPEDDRVDGFHLFSLLYFECDSHIIEWEKGCSCIKRIK